MTTDPLLHIVDDLTLPKPIKVPTDIGYTVFEVAQNKVPAEFVTPDFRYGIADALWDAGYRKVKASSPATRETVTEAKAEAWDEAIAAVAAWWQTPEDERA